MIVKQWLENFIKENLPAVVNDDDFGVATDGNGGIVQKLLPRTGQVDRNIMFSSIFPARSAWRITASKPFR